VDEVPNKKIVSVNFHHILFSLLDFLTLEAETDRLSRNHGAELPLYTACYLRRTHISHVGLALHGTV